MTTASELIKNLQGAAKGTPYIIEKTDKGFNLKLNIVDKKWYTILQKNGIKQAFTIEAVTDEAKQVATTTDVLNSLEWRAGGVAPRLGVNMATTRGEIYQFGTKKEFGISEDGKVGEVVSYTYDTGEAKQWLDAQLAKNGWKRAWGIEAKIGLVVGGIAIVGAVIAIITLPVLWALGWFDK